MAGSSPVVEIYKGVKIREINVITFKVSAPIFKFFVLESERTNLPITKLLSHSSKPCERCILTDVIAFNGCGEEVSVKRGMLSRHIPENNGRGIIQQGNENEDRSRTRKTNL